MAGRFVARGRRFALAFALLAVTVCWGLVGCGARTGLSDNEGLALDDAGVEDVAIDAPPETTLPVLATDCADAGATLVYLISVDSTLMSFYPPTATFTTIGPIACPTNARPNSMAVSDRGTAYVGFTSGELFRVSIATTECQPTPFVAGQEGFSFTFGMAFSGNSDGSGETLYVGSEGLGSEASLASIDTTTFSLHLVGAFSPPIERPELTGTGAGDLFAFYDVGSGSAIGQVDKTNAEVTAQSMLAGVTQGSGWAFAIWGGDFYTFTAPLDGTIVTRFRPSDGSIVQVATSPQVIVGAGVSTCAPQM